MSGYKQESIISKLGRILFIITIIEFVPVFIILYIYLWLKCIFKKEKSIHLRTEGDWEAFNFVIRQAFNVLGLKVEIDKRIENDFHNKSVLFMSTHGSFLDSMVIL